ncbi:membrane protein [Bombiscardovia nodaiensis]|uniref:Membrane protein n=1 Tax=Bombiscardovia nodaiensis TaxID=2932181 RepID=A0ABN6S7C5_9BIFI|nr:membrane protein [Bombiscardovia nodaiensis]
MDQAEQAGQAAGAAGRPSDRLDRNIPLNMRDIKRDYDKPLEEACVAAKASVIMRVGMLDLGSGTGSFRVREMMHRIAYPLGVHVRAEVNLTDIEATCTDGSERVTEVVDLPTTGVNTERIWLLEHFADWLAVNCGQGSTYHRAANISQELVDHLDEVKSHWAVRHAQEAEAARAAQAAQKAQAKRAAKAKRAQEGVQKGVDGLTLVPEQSAGLPLSEAAPEGLEKDSGAAVGQPGLSGQPAQPTQSGQPAPQTGQLTQSSPASQPEPSSKRDSRGLPAALRHSQPGGGVTVRQAHERLNIIEHRKPLYSPLVSGFASAVACASFVFLLGGGPYDMAGAFVGAGIGQWVRRVLAGRKINQFFVTGVAVIIAALACIGTLRFVGLFDPVALRHDTAYIGAILFVIPGFPLVTGGLDIAKMDFPSGVQRLTYAMSIILVATFGGWVVARLVQLSPQGFEALNLSLWATGGLRALAAFCGVWGFSVLFNSPQRMALVAAVIGAITDTLRLEMQDLAGMPPEMAAFLGAFLAGLLATAWRSSVRHGWLPPDVGFPRICLTVPSIVIMVPGLYMYRAMFYLGQFNTLSALDWAFRAFMVIICLPIGLATARVITDRSWRYDI